MYETYIYETYIKVLEEVERTLENRTHQCPSCLLTTGFTVTNLTSLGGKVVTCGDCDAKVLGIPRERLGEGNAKELMEYKYAHAEWILEA